MKSLRHLVLLCLLSLTLSIQFCQSTDSPAEDGASTEASADGSAEKVGDGSAPEATSAENTTPPEGAPAIENPTTPPVEIQNSALNSGEEAAVPPENLVPEAPKDGVTSTPSIIPTPSTEPVANNTSEETQSAPTQTEESVSTGPTALPELGSKMAYHIVRGDTLGLIAHKIFGDKTRWKELAQTNNLKNPDQVYAGDVLFYTLDDKSKGFSEQYEMAPKKTVTVQKGDSLSHISKKIYGHQGQWRSLWKLNAEIKNPHKLRVGQVLTYIEWGTVSTASVEAPETKATEEAKPEAQPEVTNNEAVTENNVASTEEVANANVTPEASTVE
jgi:nucleoid-associated protein YgaU